MSSFVNNDNWYSILSQVLDCYKNFSSTSSEQQQHVYDRIDALCQVIPQLPSEQRLISDQNLSMLNDRIKEIIDVKSLDPELLQKLEDINRNILRRLTDEIDGPDIEEVVYDKVYSSERALESWNLAASYYQTQGYIGYWFNLSGGTIMYYRFSAYNDNILKTNPTGLGSTFSPLDAERIPNFPQYKWVQETDFRKTQASYLGDPYDYIERIIIKKGPKIYKLRDKQEFYADATAAVKEEILLAEIKKNFRQEIINLRVELVDYIDINHPHLPAGEIRHLPDLQFFIKKLQNVKEKYNVLAPDIVASLGAYRECELIFGEAH